MPSRGAEIDHARASDFEDLARPTPRGLAASITLLRKNAEPFSAQALADRRDLLFLPFLKGIATEESRIEGLKAALALAADRLPGHYELVYRMIFLEPPGEGKLSDRRDTTLTELKKRYPSKVDNETTAVKGIEDRLIPALVKILLDPAFAEIYAEADGVSPQSIPISHSDDLPDLIKKRYCWAIDFDSDRERHQIGHKIVLLEARREAQVVFIDRYYTTGSRPTPESVEAIGDRAKHKWLNAFTERRPLRAGGGGWSHNIFYLGQTLEDGETRSVGWREVFWDKDGVFSPFIAFNATPGLESLSLAIRLPKCHQTCQAQARVTRDPMHKRRPVAEWECVPDANGWCIERFSDLQTGFEYGIYFPIELELYS